MMSMEAWIRIKHVTIMFLEILQIRTLARILK